LGKWGARSLGLVDPNGAGQEVSGEEWIRGSGGLAGSKGSCGMVCCNDLQDGTEGEQSRECLSRLKSCWPYQVTWRRGFGQGRICGAEWDRGWLGLPGSCGVRGVLGRSSRVVGGVWEVGVNKINLISFAVDNGSSIGRTCGEAEARGEQLLGRGGFSQPGPGCGGLEMRMGRGGGVRPSCNPNNQ